MIYIILSIILFVVVAEICWRTGKRVDRYKVNYWNDRVNEVKDENKTFICHNCNTTFKGRLSHCPNCGRKLNYTD